MSMDATTWTELHGRMEGRLDNIDTGYVWREFDAEHGRAVREMFGDLLMLEPYVDGYGHSVAVKRVDTGETLMNVTLD